MFKIQIVLSCQLFPSGWFLVVSGLSLPLCPVLDFTSLSLASASACSSSYPHVCIQWQYKYMCVQCVYRVSPEYICYERNLTWYGTDKQPIKQCHARLTMDCSMSFTLLLNPLCSLEDIAHILQLILHICSVPGVEKTNVQLRSYILQPTNFCSGIQLSTNAYPTHPHV